MYYVFRETRKDILIKTGPISYASSITNLSIEEKTILYHTANLETPLQHCLSPVTSAELGRGETCCKSLPIGYTTSISFYIQTQGFPIYEK